MIPQQPPHDPPSPSPDDPDRPDTAALERLAWEHLVRLARELNDADSGEADALARIEPLLRLYLVPTIGLPAASLREQVDGARRRVVAEMRRRARDEAG